MAQSRQIQDAAVICMTMVGVVPVTSFALASEFTIYQCGANGPAFYALTASYQPELTPLANYFNWAQDDARATQTAQGN